MADQGIANISPLFRHRNRFPWEYMDLTMPSVGTLHGYIACAVAPYYPEQIRHLLRGGFSKRELVRFAGAYEDKIFEQILNFVNKCEEISPRNHVAEDVLNFLGSFQPFRDDLQKRIDRGVRDNRITIPKDCESRPSWNSSSGSW